MAQSFLLSRINGDAPRAYGLAAALRIVREQVVFNQKEKPLILVGIRNASLRCSRYYEATFDSKLLPKR